jgi:hypothetical protein
MGLPRQILLGSMDTDYFILTALSIYFDAWFFGTGYG